MVIILFSRSSGREFIVEVTPSLGGDRIRLLVQRELLDGELGAQASETERRFYIKKHEADIQQVGDAFARGTTTIRMPFNKIARFDD